MIIIDTDGGFDDLVAIFYALKSKIKISAITTAYGNTSAMRSGENISDFLKLMSIDIPIYIGNTPREYNEDKNFAGKRGIFNISLPEFERHFEECSVENFYNSLTEPFEIISLAPFSNLAKIKNSNLKKILMSSGYFNLKDVKEKRMAWNVKMDIVSAEKLYQSGIETKIIGLDATGDITEQLSQLERKPSIMGKFMDEALNFTRKSGYRDFTAISDCAVFADVKESVKGRVKLSGKYDSGFANIIPDKKGEIEVATAISHDFIDNLSRMLD